MLFQFQKNVCSHAILVIIMHTTDTDGTGFGGTPVFLSDVPLNHGNVPPNQGNVPLNRGNVPPNHENVLLLATNAEKIAMNLCAKSKRDVNAIERELGTSVRFPAKLQPVCYCIMSFTWILERDLMMGQSSIFTRCVPVICNNNFRR